MLISFFITQGISPFIRYLWIIFFMYPIVNSSFMIIKAIKYTNAPLITIRPVCIMDGDKYLFSIINNDNIANPAKRYFHEPKKTFAIEISFRTKMNCTPVITASAITEANAAPKELHLGIKQRLRPKFTAAPIHTDIVKILSRFVVTRY